MSLSLWGQANAFDTDDAPKTISLAPSNHPDATSDSTDCNADDFVIASLLVADSGGKLYSVMGHACIRMQCPAYGLDYCFSYESEDVAHRVIDFFAGKLYMGMFAIPMEEYCASYREEGRGVYEYTLNLPLAIKRELWRILDEEMLKGCQQPYDYFHRGCAISCVRFVEQAIGNNGTITYHSDFLQSPRNAKDIFAQYAQAAPWAKWFVLSIAGGEADVPLCGAEQLICPRELPIAWQQATYQGASVLQKEGRTLVAGTPQYPHTKCTPMLLAIVFLLIAIVNLLWKKPYIDWCFLALQTAIGLCITYLVCFSDLCCTSWNWLIIPFNPLPAIFWHWRKYWALPFAALLMVWCIAIGIANIWIHALTDLSMVIMVCAFTCVLIKQHTESHITNEQPL